MGVMKKIRYELDRERNREENELRRAELRWGLLPYTEPKKLDMPPKLESMPECVNQLSER